MLFNNNKRDISFKLFLDLGTIVVIVKMIKRYYIGLSIVKDYYNLEK